MHGSPQTALFQTLVLTSHRTSTPLTALHLSGLPEIKAVICIKATQLSPPYSEDGLSPTPWPAHPDSNGIFPSDKYHTSSLLTDGSVLKFKENSLLNFQSCKSLLTDDVSRTRAYPELS